MKRLIPAWPFPVYIFIPGVNPHPKKEGGHMEGEKDPIAPAIDPSKPEANDFLRYAMDLYNAGYFWESHVYFEALWNTHGRTSITAEFLKGMIKLGAAGVKLQIQQPKAAEGHFLRARELFELVKKQEGNQFLGFDLQKILSSIDSALENPKKALCILPDWE